MDDQASPGALVANEVHPGGAAIADDLRSALARHDSVARRQTLIASSAGEQKFSRH